MFANQPPSGRRFVVSPRPAPEPEPPSLWERAAFLAVTAILFGSPVLCLFYAWPALLLMLRGALHAAGVRA